MKPRGFTSEQVRSTTDGNIWTAPGLISILTSGDIWPEGVTPGLGVMPDQAKIERLARAAKFGFCIDNESWDPQTNIDKSKPGWALRLDATYDKIRRDTAEMCQWAKDANPDILVGYYRGSALCNTYRSASEYIGENLPVWVYGDWRSRFERDSDGVLRPSPLFDQIDFFAIGCYPEKPPAGVETSDYWLTKMEANLGLFAMYPKVMIYLCAYYRGTRDLISRDLADLMAEWCDAAGFDHCWWDSLPTTLKLR